MWIKINAHCVWDFPNIYLLIKRRIVSVGGCNRPISYSTAYLLLRCHIVRSFCVTNVLNVTNQSFKDFSSFISSLVSCWVNRYTRFVFFEIIDHVQPMRMHLIDCNHGLSIQSTSGLDRRLPLILVVRVGK